MSLFREINIAIHDKFGESNHTAKTGDLHIRPEVFKEFLLDAKEEVGLVFQIPEITKNLAEIKTFQNETGVVLNIIEVPDLECEFKIELHVEPSQNTVSEIKKHTVKYLEKATSRGFFINVGEELEIGASLTTDVYYGEVYRVIRRYPHYSLFYHIEWVSDGDPNNRSVLGIGLPVYSLPGFVGEYDAHIYVPAGFKEVCTNCNGTGEVPCSVFPTERLKCLECMHTPEYIAGIDTATEGGSSMGVIVHKQ